MNNFIIIGDQLVVERANILIIIKKENQIIVTIKDGTEITLSFCNEKESHLHFSRLFPDLNLE